MKWHVIEGGKCAKWESDDDVRLARAPRDGYQYEVTADLIDVHPVTGKQLRSSQWWVFAWRTSK